MPNKTLFTVGKITKQGEDLFVSIKFKIFSFTIG